MPQLNPAPWLWTLLTAWFILLVLLKPTLTKLQPTTQPSPDILTWDTSPWHWTWQ
uniref:ATP synthase complex subunit 8 n=1 Tax=Cnemaspis limi TaxID=460617 RepID=K9JVQ2_CNELI|nr:ATPase subunit 8 [Cnemaspis limi]ADY86099.1 ATPase subunit 8 [Cnemaspis limi]